MTEVNDTYDRKCGGCGARLQSVNPEMAGYIPEDSLRDEQAICKRCFRIRHYNDIAASPVDENEFMSILNRIQANRCLVVAIADIFDFEGSLIPGLHRFAGANPVILVVNKMDILPKSVNWNRILNWVRKQVKEFGLKVEDIVLCSAERKLGFENVITAIEQVRQGRDVYVVGATNVGKSTLINRLIRDYSDLDAELTISGVPGTTLDTVSIPLADGKSIIDTPGIVYAHRLTEVVPVEVLPKIMPARTIKPLVFQLKEQQTLFFGACARLDFLKGDPMSFTCYVANTLSIHRTKLEKADELYEKRKGDLLTPPTLQQLESINPFTKQSIRIRAGEQKDMYLSGLGWIKVNGKSGAQLTIHYPKGLKFVLRDALI